MELSEADLPVDEVYRWTGRPDCGAVVLFSGTARDHAPGRPDVTLLSYEAYAEQVVPAMESIAGSIRRKWPDVRRVAMVHRVGDVPVGSEAVVVAVSSPHRDEAFQAARFAIDTTEGHRPDLEARALERRRRLGPRRPAPRSRRPSRWASGVVVNNAVYLLVAAMVSAIGMLILWLRHRTPTSSMSSIDEFNDKMRALSPEGPRRKRSIRYPSSDDGPRTDRRVESSGSH